MKIELVEKKKETKDVTSFIFESRVPIKWTAGQFLFYTFPHPNPDERGITRYFTISAVPFEKHIMLTTRFAGNKSSSFKQKLFSAPIGTEFEVTDPDGDFIVDLPRDKAGDPGKKFIFISGGIGITPYRSILLDLDHRNLPINVTLLYANHNNDFLFKDELEKLAAKHPTFKIKYFVSPKHIEKEDIQKAIEEMGDEPVVYFSGPEPMTEAFEKLLKEEMGLPEERVKLDFFPGYDPIR